MLVHKFAEPLAICFGLVKKTILSCPISLCRRCASHPSHSVTCDVGWYLVPTVEFAERDVVTTLPQFENDPAAAAVNRKNRVGLTMRDEEPWCSVRRAVDHETRRKCDHATEQVAVYKA